MSAASEEVGEIVNYFSQEGTVTNPAIWLVFSAVRIFLSLTTVTVTAGNSAGEIVVFVNFREWTTNNRQPLIFLHSHRRLINETAVFCSTELICKVVIGQYNWTVGCNRTPVIGQLHEPTTTTLITITIVTNSRDWLCKIVEVKSPV